MDYYPIQGGVEIPLHATETGPLGSYADLT